MGLGGAQQLLSIAFTVLAMAYAVGAIWAIFMQWHGDRAHPSVLMGSAAIAVSATALPLWYTSSAGQDAPHSAFFIVIAAIAMLLTSACITTALGRIAGDRYLSSLSSPELVMLEQRLQAFPRTLESAALDDIADTYDAVREGIRRAVENGTCSRDFIRTQVGELRSLADRVGVSPTADAIRSEARLFKRKAGGRLRQRHVSAAQFIQRRCRQRFAAAVLANRQLNRPQMPNTS